MVVPNISLCLSFALIATSTQLFAADWLPVTAEELALKTPRVEANADAEALFWEIHVADSDVNQIYRNSFSHYVRLKIFTERGAKEFSTVNVDYFGDTKIHSVIGRTIQPDGSIQELARDAVFDRVLAKGRGFKIHSKSFVMPGGRPGSIVEYQYNETRENAWANYFPLTAQADYPVQRLTYHIKPLTGAVLMRYRPFNCRVPPFTLDRDGYFSTSLSNIPAFHEEPEMPPENETRQWILIYYEQVVTSPPISFGPPSRRTNIENTNRSSR